MKFFNPLFLFIILAHGLSLIGQDHIQFKNYTISDGLSQSFIHCIVQDDLSSIWLGTQDGINRFNGKTFDVFSADKGYDISNEYIHASKKDLKGDIWFGTYNGLVQYNPKLEKFKSFTLKDGRRIEIKAIAFDKQGNLWLGTPNGNIFIFDINTQQFTLKLVKPLGSGIVDILFNDEKVYILSEYDGILITNSNLTEKKNISFKSYPGETECVANKIIKSPINEVLVASSKGLFVLNEKKVSFEQYLPQFHEDLHEINVVDALFLADNRLLLASESNGLFQISNTNESDESDLLNYSGDAFQKGALLSDKLKGIYQDKFGVIWIASQRGLSSFDPNNVGFKGVSYASNIEHGLVSQNVWGFHEDKHTNYLFVAGDHGISRFDKINHKYDHFYVDQINKSDATVLALYVISKNRVLVGSFNGLYELIISDTMPENYSFKLIPHTEEKFRGFDKNYKIVPSEIYNTYLIGTRAGLAIYDHSENSFNYFYNNPEDSTSISPGPCRLVFKTLDDKYYVAPSSGSIYEIIWESDSFHLSKAVRFEKMESLTKDYFTCFLQTSQSEFWFGTMGDGLFYFNEKLGEVKHYNKTNGLPNNVIYGLETNSNAKAIWMSTNRGLVSYNTISKTFSSFSEEDGVLSNELNLGASFTSQTGEIYFGGIQGFNYFNPSENIQKTANLNVVFSRIDIENQRVDPNNSEFIDKSISFTKQLTLPYKSRSIAIYFYADDLSRPDQIEYKYSLSGDDDVNEELGEVNLLRFSSLAPGNYLLRVFARQSGGEWSKNPAELSITVATPFWMTWWFYSMIIAIVSYVVYRVVRNSINKERIEQVKLELKIAERTKEIRDKTAEIELQKVKLESQKKELENEKVKSERLLSNLLPKGTASELMNDGRSAARDFNMVSVMFTDFVGFSTIAETMSAKNIVSVLDHHFKKFDEIIDKHDLEKIKTIGDAYMCAGGVPIRDKTNPINTILAALEIQHYMGIEKQKSIELQETPWILRIGINTGPVSAGVIGSTRLAYDVWGRTVNRAERMERMCTPESIAITEATFDFIEPYFECEPKGKVLAKGGMEITMYEVKSIKPELSIDGLGFFPNEAFHKLVDLHHYSQINYNKAERFILNKLKTELSPKLHYHSYDHSKDVTRQAERIAVGEGITDEDLFLLKTAASYHDAGFVRQYDKNEPIGAEMAQEILPNFGYTQTHIDRIKELIFVTQIPHQPKDKLEEIICDADLDYLGRDDFHEIADNLRKELKEHGKIDSDRKWDEIQVSFLMQHRYFTQTSIDSRRAKKLANLEIVKERIQRNEYKD